MKKKIIAIGVAAVVTIGGLALGVKLPESASVIIGETAAEFITAGDEE